MSRIDPVPRDPGGGERDVGLALTVEPLPRLDPRCEDAELLELACEFGRDPGALAELGHLDLVFLAAEARGATLGALGARRPQLLPDHAERQELVPLEPQDRDQPFDIRLGEEPVAAPCPAGMEKSLILEVPDLRNRDVGKLVAQALAHGADRVEVCGWARFGHGRHQRRNVNRYLPT